MRDLFPGAATVLPSRSTRGAYGFGYTYLREGVRAPEPVRHAAGYAPFVAFVVAQGADPAPLAGDLAALGAFAHEHREALQDPALAEAAAVFLGNVLVVVHPRASWRTTTEPEVGTDAMSMPVRGAFASMRDDPAFTARMAAELPARWTEADARHDERASAMDEARAAADGATLTDVTDFVPPLLVTGPFLDEQGEPIPYGARWEYPEGPPEDAHSRVTHPERFAPLVSATEALLAHLERCYDVERTQDDDGAVVLRPTRGAPIRILITDFPAVRLRAGLLLDETQPDCGCDACDETAASAIDAVVRTVQGVVAGGFAEHWHGLRGPGAFSLRYEDGRSTGSASLPDDRLVDPADVVALRGGAWPAWPRRI